jgi:hypothetical protein
MVSWQPAVEPTLRAYHTGKEVAARASFTRKCVEVGKTH